MNNRLTAEEYRAGQLTEQAEKREVALEQFVNLTYRYPGSSYHPWKGLTFDQGGAARLASIAGWLTGLSHAGSITGSPMEQLAACAVESLDLRGLAGKMALDLDKILIGLANCGDREVEVEKVEEGAEQTVTVPATKVLLGDDGTFNGFSVLRFRPYTRDQIHDKAREVDEAAYQGKEADGTEIPEVEQGHRWDAALRQARQSLGIRKELEELRSWTPSWIKAKRERIQEAHKEHVDTFTTSIHSCPECGLYSYELSGSYEIIEYGFTMNGGLLYRGPGGANAFSINIDPGAGTERFWSLHS
jgi:hypothetical protein